MNEPVSSSDDENPPLDSLPPTVSKRQRIEPVQSVQLGRQLLQMDWIEDWLGSKSYGAPRVFDLFTLMAMMIGFALLFGGMKLIEPLLFNAMPTVLWVVTAYCMLTGLAQMFLWGGERPRLASLVAGPILWIGIGLIVVIVYQQRISQVGSSQILRQLQSFLPGGFFVICSSVVGILSGYVAGGAVAGVFLIADWIRTKVLPSRPAVIDDDSSSIWEDAHQTPERDESS
ncbi:MAG: hypothetical protein AAGG44_09600 [Planctomycetota bacterium]